MAGPGVKYSSLALFVLGTGVSIACGQPGILPSGIASGDATPTSVVLWARADAPGDVVFELATDANFANIIDTHTVAVTDTIVPAKVETHVLVPNTTYYFRATNNSITTVGTFLTPADGANRHPLGLRVGVSGDWRGELSSYPAVKNVPERDLDLWIALGDTIYADVASPQVNIPQCLTLPDFRAKHRETLSERFGLNTLADLRATCAMLAMIDDHEVTNDFAGGAHPSSDPRFANDPGAFINETVLYTNGIAAFTEYHPMLDEQYGMTGDPRTENKAKLYRSRTYGRDAAVIVADARSFRDEELPGVTDPLDPVQVIGFLVASFDPTRTMLGAVQLAEIKADLLAAQQSGVTWKLVCVPEPIQNLGVLAASDRFEGYAAERTELLKFIDDNDIENVVFIAADIHGTLINNLTYTLGPGTTQIFTNSFEVTTGSVAYAAPFGPTVVGLANQFGFPGVPSLAQYLAMSPVEQEAVMTSLINTQLQAYAYDTLGLQNSPISATLLQGGYTATNTFGWTEFEIDPVTQALTVTTWGIPWYDEPTLLANPSAIAALNPEVINQFVVMPQDGSYCYADCDNSGTLNIFDYICYGNAYAGSAAYADCDSSGSLNIFDYICYGNAYAGGCQ
ncbi:MAG: alkaline phosphatase D family protein [Phycisphaeraceae bacterium]|nr:alkaline phosphatase D family protein [Phycisphaerales bacterium]MCB9859698.1 alkaline phosphatase D family protein [Phycisphaeraceae bacterium]